MGNTLHKINQKRSKKIPKTNFQIDVNSSQVGANSTSSDSIGKLSIQSESAVKLIGGRPYLDENASVYLCPTDWEEADRLQLCHFILKKLFGGSYAANLSNIIKPGSKILDIGCGPGPWCFELAQEFPYADIYGLDILSSFPDAIKPPNCHFQLCNVLKGLPFDNDEFDYIFMRHMILALKEEQWAPLLTEIKRVMKPGGVIECVEFDWAARSAGPVHTEFIKRWSMSKTREMDLSFTSKLKQTIIDIGFQNVNRICKPVSLGKWDEKQGKIGEIWNTNLAQMVSGMKSVSVPIMNITDDEWDCMLKDVDREVDKFRSYQDHYFFLATK
ncbi:145_t:CDS:2 [Scutellospora calospora]|uniref:145_t:CDS:1 n=1 Tax=Scutellospora calospora TaxID=85575 RepID=A0ACA9LKW2_9GLOM|nr:145_t:CDS:2 [Scutellospora calospora]